MLKKTDTVVFVYIFDSSAYWSIRGGSPVHQLGLWMATVCLLEKETMSSLSSSGAVLSVPVSASSSRASLAEMLRKTTRVMASRRRRKAILISWFHLCWRAFAVRRGITRCHLRTAGFG